MKVIVQIILSTSLLSMTATAEDFATQARRLQDNGDQIDSKMVRWDFCCTERAARSQNQKRSAHVLVFSGSQRRLCASR